jgi:hypothetical protein
MSSEQRSKSVALIKFTVTSKTVSIDPGEVLDLHPGDRLLFDSDNGQNVLVNLGGDETSPSGTLVALVKVKVGPNFSVEQLPDGRFIVTLNPPQGNGDPPDPP